MLVKIVTQAIWFCDMLHELVLHAIAEVSVMILIEGQKIGVLINRKPKNKKASTFLLRKSVLKHCLY